MKRFFFCLISLCCSLQALEVEIPEPYCSIEDLPFDPHGWFFNAEPLGACLLEKPITTVIEVGAWLGASTRFLASGIVEGGKVYAVDTWRGSPLESYHLEDPRYPYLFQLFLSNVKHSGLTDRIVPIRMDSLEAARALKIKADLIYIDASHDTESVYKDILAWMPHLNEGGIFCGDDWCWQTVAAAVHQAAATLNKRVSVQGNLWRLVD